MIDFLPLYIQGLLKIWPLWTIIFLAIAWTGISERRDRVEKKMAKANQRHNIKRRNH